MEGYVNKIKDMVFQSVGHGRLAYAERIVEEYSNNLQFGETNYEY